MSQNADQFINLEEPHGFNLGAAGMPNGITNNLHLHFTAEVFINFGGTFRLRWGVDGKQGEYVSHDGDVISVPTWIFRGFTNEGPDDGILLTVLGRDVTGGIIWGPSVLKEAESYGLHLTADNRLIDTVAGDDRAPRCSADQADAAALHRRPDASTRRRRCAPGSSNPATGVTARSPSSARGLPGGTPSSASASGTGCPRTGAPFRGSMSRMPSTSPGCAPRPARDCCDTGTTKPRC